MNLDKFADKSQIAPQEHIINAHEFLKKFLDKYHTATRGGIHDFMEISLFNMINLAIKNIDNYLATGHTSVDATQIMHITIDSYQKVLDNIKRNLETMKKVNFK